MTTTSLPPRQPAPASPAGQRPQRRWCRGSRLLVAASLGWLGYVLAQVLAQRVRSGRAWLQLVPDLAPPLVFLVVPLLLLAVPAALALARVRLPAAACLWTVGAAAAALVLGLSR
jgi:hypothetical protein